MKENFTKNQSWAELKKQLLTGETAPYVLLFSKELNEVEASVSEKEQEETVRFKKGAVKALGGGLMEQEILEGAKSRYFLYAAWEGSENLVLACEHENGRILPVSPGVPRLYDMAPIEESGNFPFPVMLASPELRKEMAFNGRFFDWAVKFYGYFLYLLMTHGYQRLDHVITLPDPGNISPALSEWYQEHLYQPLFDVISQSAIIPTREGRKSILDENVRIPGGSCANERKKIQKLLKEEESILVPLNDADWGRAFAGYPVPEKAWISFSFVLDHAQEMIDAWQKKDPYKDLTRWASELYLAAMDNPDLEKKIMSGETAIFVTQDYYYKVLEKPLTLKTISEVYCDPDIPSFLKAYAEISDYLYNEEDRMNLTRVLVHPEFPVIEGKKPDDYQIGKIVDYISQQELYGFVMQNEELDQEEVPKILSTIWGILLSHGPDQELKKLAYEFTSWDYSKGSYNYKPDSRIPASMWANSYKGIVRSIADQLSDMHDIHELCEESFLEPENAFRWLNEFYRIAVNYLPEDAFPALYSKENRLRFLTSENTEHLRELMRLAGTGSMEELCSLIEARKTKASNEQL